MQMIASRQRQLRKKRRGIDALKVETICIVLTKLLKGLPGGLLELTTSTWQRRVTGFLAAFASVVTWRRLHLRRTVELKNEEINAIKDPTFGPLIVHDLDKPDNMHEAFLDSLHLEKESPIRGHLCQLFRRPDMDEQLGKLYDQISNGAPRIDREGFMRLSRGIYGHLHQLLKGEERMPLAQCTPEDQKWIFRHFDHFFPPERPLDRKMFQAYFKLILMRRIVRTLVAHIGLPSLRRGTSAPLVLVVGVDLGDNLAPFRLNTVTPNAKTVLCGESLAPIEEISQEVEVALPKKGCTLVLTHMLDFIRKCL